MTKAVQWRRGTTTEHAIFTGLEGEITVDTDKETLRIHDGTKAGGYALAREDLSNVTDADFAARGLALSDMTNVASEDIATRGIAKTDLSNLTTNADASEGKKGVVQLATTSESQAGLETTKAVTPVGLKASIASIQGLPNGYIEGLTLSIGTDTAHDITISTGEAKSADKTTSMTLANPLTKKIDATWVAGNNMGGMPAPLTAQPLTTYHMFILCDPTSGATDAGFDTDINATNLLGISGSYTKYKHIGSIITDSNSNVIPFITRGNGKYVDIFYTTEQEDLNTTTNPNTWSNLQLSVPTGIEIKPYTHISAFQDVAYTSTTQFRSKHIGGEGLILKAQESQGEYITLSDQSMLTDINGQVEYKVLPENAGFLPVITVKTFGYGLYR